MPTLDDDDDLEFAHIQDVLGQMTSLKTYASTILSDLIKKKLRLQYSVLIQHSRQTVISLAFETEMPSDILLQRLCSASEQLVKSFPYLAGHVVCRARSPDKIPLVTVIPYASGRRTSLVVYKDCKDLCAPLKTILSQGAPMGALDGHVLAGYRPMPDSYHEEENLAPVLEIQANSIYGGVILTFQGNHHIMDMNGMGHIIRFYAQALRSETFSPSDVAKGNCDRRNIIPLLGPEDDKVDISSKFPRDFFFNQDLMKAGYIVLKKKQPAIESEVPASCVKWAYFHFPSQKLSQLKSLASTAMDSNLREQSPPWVSTDDILTALICTRITAVRLKRMEKPTTVTFSRAVNGRRFLDIPAAYLGHLVWCVDTEIPLNSPLATTDFAGLARRLRLSLDSVRPEEIQSFATALNALADKGALACGASLKTSGGLDLVVSSWAALGFSQTVFGELGRPVFCKRPNFGPVEGLVYIQPKTVDGDLDVAFCLNVEDIRALEVDETFMEYAEYIG